MTTNTADVETAPTVLGDTGSEQPQESSATPWTLRRRLGRATVAMAVAVVVIVAVILVVGLRFVVAGNAVVNRWQPAQLSSERVLADLVNQETGVRGYTLTRRQSSLQPYFEYRARERKDLSQLKSFIGHDTELAGLVRTFERRAYVWHRDFAAAVITEIRQGRPAATGAVDAGRSAFDRIRAAASRVSDALDHRADAARSERVLDGSLIGIALGLGIALVLGAVIVVRRGLDRWVLGPVDRLGTQTRHVASGELSIHIVGDGPSELIDLGADVDFMRAQIVLQLGRAEQVTDDLRRKGDELERSNADLQQFAYVASHDLSEPLRKVANFCQLLERQYGPQLDDRARQYIDFAVDGAKRMQLLITDLLALSRVGRNTDEFVPVDLDAALNHALSTLTARIDSSGARVERPEHFPVVAGDRSLLTSLLENLVGNAVKYHRDDVEPMVWISVDPAPVDGMWQFSVRDNGIGIEAQYAERIFQVFQRLHLRDQFGGTGIGLALCRRIVDFHGGRIWLDTVESGTGSTFRFTLPEGSPHA